MKPERIGYSDKPKLIEPDAELREQFLDMCREMTAFEEQYSVEEFEKALKDFDGYIVRKTDYKAGRNLPAGWVACSEFWLVGEKRVLGVSSFRHTLTAGLEEYGGHIGYHIRPSQRKRGCGTEILRQTLLKAAEMNLQHVLLTCGDTNVASIRVIEKNGGRLRDIIWSENLKRYTRRYWIQIK